MSGGTGRLNDSSGMKPSGMLWSSQPGLIGGLEQVDETGESDLMEKSKKFLVNKTMAEKIFKSIEVELFSGNY